jgi:phosphatidylglycerol:prolipoprotein diacylglycerol transferase
MFAAGQETRRAGSSGQPPARPPSGVNRRWGRSRGRLRRKELERVRQILLRIPIPGTEHGLTLYGYGAMMCLGFLLAILVAARRARRLGQPPDIIYNAALFCFFGGLIGSRLFYVIQYGEHFHSIWDLVKIWEGGLTFYGGFLMAVLATVGYLLVARLPILYWLDILAPSVALGEAFGRLGCFLNGCCYGGTCPPGWGFAWPAGTIPWEHYADLALATSGLGPADMGGAVTGALATAWHAPVIFPTQLISFTNAMLLFLVLYAMFPFKRRHGQVLVMFVLLYGISRFLLECLRADEADAYLLGLPTLLSALGQNGAAGRLPLLTISQNLAILMVAGSVTALALLARSRRPQLQASYAPPPSPMACAEASDSKPPQRRKEKRS